MAQCTPGVIADSCQDSECSTYRNIEIRRFSLKITSGSLLRLCVNCFCCLFQLAIDVLMWVYGAVVDAYIENIPDNIILKKIRGGHESIISGSVDFCIFIVRGFGRG